MLDECWVIVEDDELYFIEHYASLKHAPFFIVKILPIEPRCTVTSDLAHSSHVHVLSLMDRSEDLLMT